MRLTLEVNGLRGEWTFSQAEERAQMLLDLGRAVPPDRWVAGLLRRSRQESAGAFLDSFI